MDDSALAVRAAAGDAEAFTGLVERHGGRVLAVARRIAAGDGSRAEDLTQEVFLHLLRVLPRYDPARPFLPWLLRVAGNLCRNRMRGERRRPAVSLDALAEESGTLPPDPGDGPGAAAEQAELDARVRAARDALPPAHRTILALHYEGGLSYDDLAATLDLPLGTVKNRLHRARAALARRLS